MVVDDDDAGNAGDGDAKYLGMLWHNRRTKCGSFSTNRRMRGDHDLFETRLTISVGKTCSW
jgi:hypothetical protein